MRLNIRELISSISSVCRILGINENTSSIENKKALSAYPTTTPLPKQIDRVGPPPKHWAIIQTGVTKKTLPTS